MQMLLFGGFAILHLILGKSPGIVIADSVAFLAVSALFWLLTQTRKAALVGHLNTLIGLLFFPVFIHFNQNQDFGLIWVFFVPFILVALNGWRIGLFYLSVFYAVVFTQAYMGIGNWQDGLWSELSFVRFVVSSLMGVLLAVVVDETHSRLHHALEMQNVKERRYVNQLQHFSNTDSLTTLYNRHYLNKVVDAKVKELQGSPLYITFFILDIDQFKLYNDYFGHPEGDKVLRRVAQTVKHYIRRRDDLVFRLGGEEFGGLLVSDHPHETSRWVAQLTEQVEALQIAHAPGALHPVVTVSVGIFSARMDGVKTFETLYRSADCALYQAKQIGRNQAVTFNPEEQLEAC
ncbi:GGDEF domain-containing protein [Thiomicrorhabdus cannonii]|uniref:GGDEF domain-containing protein n=1 Tax=Thiomicrorhabdus cannonii TaxID=2748011 RepID=UPI0015BBC22C|nr:GGDEF domain-containing protein [Thiomicrorhabdus cannonii]